MSESDPEEITYVIKPELLKIPNALPRDKDYPGKTDKHWCECTDCVEMIDILSIPSYCCKSCGKPYWHALNCMKMGSHVLDWMIENDDALKSIRSAKPYVLGRFSEDE